MSFAYRSLQSSARLLLLPTAIMSLSHCNSDKEKTVYPNDPNTPALFAPSDLSDSERKKRMDEATSALRAAELEADRELEQIKARSAQRRKEAAQRLAEAQKITREQARENLKGTRLDSLTLSNGETFSRVSILRADEVGLTISHRDGARRIKYSSLPTFLQEKCMYTPNIVGDANTISNPASLTSTINNQIVSHTRPSSPQHPTSLSNKTKNSQKKNTQSPKIPDGEITVTVIKTYSRYISGMGKVHFKRLRIVAKSNVEATLYSDNKRLCVVYPDKQADYEVESNYHGKYEVQLIAKNGKLLDSETSTRKSGISGARGLSR